MKDIEVAFDMLTMKLAKVPGIVEIRAVARKFVVTVRADANPTIPASCGGFPVKMERA